ncbi:MAG TPA: VOC family protein [Anaerolineae bacterium]|nr:VOC family protein [Anaerolineae bacterium]HRV92237.1 VOC family protein [Anaerolineae bacterium]
MTKIKGIAEIVLNVHDLQAAVAFYKEVLGLEEIGRPGPVFLKAGDPAVSIPQLVVLVPLPAGADNFVAPRTLHHLALELAPEDFDAEEQRLKSLGYALRYGQHPVLPSRTMYVDDPSGNEVEFICGA